MKKRGFTLIELLAVIVILAIVALVATPVILNIINSSSDSAKDSSGRLIIKSVQNAYSMYVSDNLGKLPTENNLIRRFNNMMDNGTRWVENEIVSNNVTCSSNFDDTNITLVVNCILSDNTVLSTRPLQLRTPSVWEARGLNSEYLKENTIYEGLPGTIMFNSDGSILLIDEEGFFDSLSIDSALENNYAVAYDDGFSMIIEDVEKMFLFTFTGEGTAMFYFCDSNVEFDRETIIAAATEEGDVYEYFAGGSGSWSDRGLSTEYVQYNKNYNSEMGTEYTITINDNGSMIFFSGSIPSLLVDSFISNGSMFVDSNVIAICPDGRNYYMFVFDGLGTAKLYASSSDNMDNFNREWIEDHHSLVVPYIIESN